MKFTRAEITAKSEAKKREDGMILKRHWIPNKPEAIAELKRQATLINKQYGDL
jgi:hypothetical protein